jgi:hypothetical protein
MNTIERLDKVINNEIGRCLEIVINDGHSIRRTIIDVMNDLALNTPNSVNIDYLSNYCIHMNNELQKMKALNVIKLQLK